MSGGCSRPSVAILVGSTCPSTAPLSRFTSKPLGQKGNAAPVHGPLLRRADNEDGGPGGRPGSSGALPPATRIEPPRAKGQHPCSATSPSVLCWLTKPWTRTACSESCRCVAPQRASQPRRTATSGAPGDREACKWRHRMENCVASIKEYRSIAPRSDKTASSFAANWHLMATLLASR